MITHRHERLETYRREVRALRRICVMLLADLGRVGI